MKNKQFRLAVMTALFTAIITLCTAFLKLPVLSNGGYIHFGDAVIMLCAVLFPTPYAVFAGAIGGTFADIIGGAVVWAPWTLVIKAVVAMSFSSKGEKIVCARSFIGFIPTAIVTIGGYYLAEAVLYGNFVTPLFAIWGNAVQVIGSAVIFIALGMALDKINFKKKIIKL